MKSELIQILNNHKNKQNQLPLSYRIYRKNNKWYLQVIITIITVYNGFISTDINKIKLLKSFKVNKFQMLKY